MAVQARVDLFGRQSSASIDQHFHPLSMAMQAHGDLFGRQWGRQGGSKSVDQKCQLGIMAVQAVSARRLCGRETQKFDGELVASIHCDLRKRLSSSLERGGGAQLIRTALNEEQSSPGNCLRASSNVAEESCDDSPRQRFHRGQELSIDSACENGDIKGRLQSHVRHSQSRTFVQETNWLPKDYNGEKNNVPNSSARESKRDIWNNVPNSSARESKRDIWQVGRGGGNAHRPSANSTSEAVAFLKNRQQQGVVTDSYTLVEVLKRCSKQKDLLAARQVHDCIIQSGMDKHPYVATALVNVYIRCGILQDARRVFDGLEKKTVVTWSIMIAGYAKNHNVEDALEVFTLMHQVGERPDELTCLSILKACASPLALKWGKEVHAYIIDAGLESDVRIGTALMQMYAKCGCLTEAGRVFDKLINRDVVTWNVMIGANAESGCAKEAYRLFLQMEREGFKPNEITYMNILNVSASAGALKWVKEVHSHALKAGLESDLRVGTALLHMYAKCGSIDDAHLLFDRMERRDLIMWNTMIGAYAKTGGVDAYRLFLQMQREGFKPDAITYVSILNASAGAGALEWVNDVHSHVLKAGLETDVRVGTALVHMYAKSGSIENARLVFDRMENRGIFTWNIMIGGLAQHGYGHEALELFRKMNADGVKPDETSFVAVLSACCHAGLLDEGRRLFLAMRQDYGIEPSVELCTCVVDLLGRAGHLEEAKLFIGDMPLAPDEVTWRALLGACRTYGNVELGELAAEELLKLEPKNASSYVLLSNIYAAAGKWEKVSLVRRIMQKRGVRKEPGRSWIEVDSKIHEFVVGDTSHPEAKAIYSELNKLTEKLKTEGYIPDTQLVLHNIDEEDKELALCSHSEKLAIAYGLMRTPRGKPIRVYKNLRVCLDCHTATKLIAKVTGREIIARDANRFHHFKGGVCSCGDYW